MNLSRAIVEKRPALRFHLARATSALILRRAFAHLGAGSVIVRPRVLRGTERMRIGDGCVINEGAWLQCEPGDGTLTLGDGVYLGHDVHLHADDPITIGSGCVLADGVFMASTDHDLHGDRHGSHATGPITLGDRVFLGQRAVVLGGVSIGDGATVGAHSVVTKDVPAGATVVGSPARPLIPKDQPQ